jgi:hypothetical protein
VLYFVYLLYDTQQCSPKIRIPITHGIWRELQKLFVEIKENQLVDAYHVFARLHRNNYYSYVAHIRIAPLSNSSSSHFHRNIHDCLESVNSDRVAHLLDLRRLSDLSQRYHKSKVLVAGVSEEEEELEGGVAMNGSLHLLPHTLPPSLNVANSQFIEELQDLIENFEREKYLRHPSVPPTTILALNYANPSSASISTPIVISPRVRKGRPPRSSAPLPPSSSSSSPSIPSPSSPLPKSIPKGRRRAQSRSTPPPHEEQIPQPPQSQQDKGKEKDDEEEEDLGGELQHMPSLSLATIGLTPSFSSSSSSSYSTPSLSCSASKGGRNANKRPRTKK